MFPSKHHGVLYLQICQIYTFNQTTPSTHRATLELENPVSEGDSNR